MVSISKQLTNEKRDERGYEGVVDETKRKEEERLMGFIPGARQGRAKARQEAARLIINATAKGCHWMKGVHLGA